jgi:CHASE3 domain sensor protein
MLSWLAKIRLWELALLLLCGFGSYFFWTTAQSEKQITAKTVTVLDHADKTLTSVDHTLQTTTKDIDRVSRSLNSVLTKLLDPCRPVNGHIYAVDEDKPCGTLADVARTLHTIRGFAGTLEVAGRHLNKSLATYDKQEADIADNTNAVLSNLSSTIDFAHFLMSSHQALLDNLQRLSANSADTMDNVKGITADIRVQTKALNEPKTKTQKFLQWMPPLVRTAITVGCATMGPC